MTEQPILVPEASRAERARQYVMELLERDIAYDEDLVGDPPLLVADYRRAMFAVLALGSTRVRRAAGVVTEAEAAAFAAGGRSFLDVLVVALFESWRPERLRERGRPGQHVPPPRQVPG